MTDYVDPLQPVMDLLVTLDAKVLLAESAAGEARRNGQPRKASAHGARASALAEAAGDVRKALPALRAAFLAVTPPNVPGDVPEALYAWVGEDEFQPGRYGIKQGLAAFGPTALASEDFFKLESYRGILQVQVAQYGKPIRLVRFLPQVVLADLTPKNT